MGIKAGLKHLIIGTLDAFWLAEKEDEVMGFVNMTALKSLQQLENYSGTLHYLDMKMLKNDAMSLILSFITPCSILIMLSEK